MVRKACKADVERMIALLHQVNMVHHVIRPDLFKPHTTKYSAQELEALLGDESKPIFVFEDRPSADGQTDRLPVAGQTDRPSADGCADLRGEVVGYAFCQVTAVANHALLQDAKTLYIDDICVDERARGQHVGTALYEHVVQYARSIGCHNITLNVWEGNESALAFYRSMGMGVQKTTMEVVL